MLSNNATADLITKDGKTFQNYSYKIVNAGLLISDYENDVQTLVRWENLPNDLREKYKKHEQRFIEEKKIKAERKKQKQEQMQLDKITYNATGSEIVNGDNKQGVFMVSGSNNPTYWFLVDCPPECINGNKISPNAIVPHLFRGTSHASGNGSLYGRYFTCDRCAKSSPFVSGQTGDLYDVILRTKKPYVVIFKKSHSGKKNPPMFFENIEKIKNWMKENKNKQCRYKEVHVYYIGKKEAFRKGVKMVIPVMTYSKEIALKKLKEKPNLVSEFEKTTIGQWKYQNIHYRKEVYVH